MDVIFNALSPCDANTDANGFTWKKVMFYLFLWIWPNKCSGAIDNSIGILKICLDIVKMFFRHVKMHNDMFSHFVDTSRHFRNMQKHLDISRHY